MSIARAQAFGTVLDVSEPLSPVPLAERMRSYEHAYRRTLPPRTYTILRLDGVNFSALTRRLGKPFDSGFATAMVNTGLGLCADMAGCAYAYVASDEINLLLTDFAKPTTQAWLGGVEAKMLSISAALATRHFDAHCDLGGVFDARVFTLPDPVEVANYFVWRQRDTIRNAVSMAAHTHLAPQAVHGASSEQKKSLLREVGVYFDDYPTWARQGTVIAKTVGDVTVTYTRRGGAAVTEAVRRSVWAPADAPALTAHPDGWLAQRTPLIPAATAH